MPNTFKLGAFTLDTQGNVLQGGTWKTLADNKISVTTDDGASQSFAVAWRFTTDNQLILSSAGADLCNWNPDSKVTPKFTTSKAVLTVQPDELNPFSFELRGKWNLNATHDLTFTTPDGTVSTIKGIVNFFLLFFFFRFTSTWEKLVV